MEAFEGFPVITSAREFIELRTSDDPDDQNRASRDSAPLEVWEELVRDHPEMRFWVTQNKTVPNSVLETLARDEDRQIRSMVARKRKLDPAIARVLANDSDEGVRLAIVNNGKTPDDILRLLLDDQWDRIRTEAARRLAT